MSQSKHDAAKHQRWASFRLSVIGGLLASPPSQGELATAIEVLALKTWKDPISGELKSFSFSTIERWYYLAKEEQSPIEKLRKKVREDRGLRKIEGTEFASILESLYRDFPSWTKKLHYDNLVAKAKEVQTDLIPSYSTVRRWMSEKGMNRQRDKNGGREERINEARAKFDTRETRSFQAPHPGALWHLDFHHGRREVVTRDGRWIKPIALAIIDDRSRFICHIQWYEHENTENLVHGFRQALQKNGVPRALMSDNGASMISAEFTEGLKKLSIIHETTLPYCPEQNGKQERFWGNIEGRLMAMLQNKKEITLRELNDFTNAWVHEEYNGKLHSEVKSNPRSIFFDEKRVFRDCPSGEDLGLFFTRHESRTPRRGDATISILGKRFEIPDRYRNIKSIYVRFRHWDISRAWIVDPERDELVETIYPQDTLKNYNLPRKQIHKNVSVTMDDAAPDAPAPLLQKMMEDYSAHGLPSLYLEKDYYEK